MSTTSEKPHEATAIRPRKLRLSISRRPGLLVSVRNAAEAKIAIDAGADVVDVKEPLRGSLGAPEEATLRQVVEIIQGRCPISAARGELRDIPSNGQDVEPWQGIDFVKLGLAGCGAMSDWSRRWRLAMERIRGAAELVAVVYADWRSCLAPRPEEIAEAAGEIGAAALLVDTFDKSRGNLFDHWPVDQVTRFVGELQAAGRLVVLAGSLRDAALQQAVQLRPDLVAVRGAACDGDRTQNISSERIWAIRGLMGSEVVDCDHKSESQLARILPPSL